MSIYQDILLAKATGKKLLAVLIDPEKMDVKNVPAFFDKIHQSSASHIFVGGSTDKHQRTAILVATIKNVTNLPVLLFPGDVSQISQHADGILFLSLISGRNAEYLIEQQIRAVPILRKLDLEIIPTGYILIDGKKETATQRVSGTKPIAQNNLDLILNTALAGEFSGKKLTYLEAGSGATKVVHPVIIESISKNTSIPLIVGGGIRSKKQLTSAFNAGADLVVIGTAFEQDETFFEALKK